MIYEAALWKQVQKFCRCWDLLRQRKGWHTQLCHDFTHGTHMYAHMPSHSRTATRTSRGDSHAKTLTGEHSTACKNRNGLFHLSRDKKLTT